jgi:major type 1 subunit fimbrin (pilin)
LRIFRTSIGNPESQNEQIVIVEFLQSAIRNPQSAIRNPQSAIRNPQSAIRNPQSAILADLDVFLARRL